MIQTRKWKYCWDFVLFHSVDLWALKTTRSACGFEVPATWSIDQLRWWQTHQEQFPPFQSLEYQMWWEGGWIWYSREIGLCSLPPATAHVGLIPLMWWVRRGSSLLPPPTHRRCVNPPHTCVGPTCAVGRVRFPHSYKLTSSSLPPLLPCL